jgi:fatty-acyl-CoA synthase
MMDYPLLLRNLLERAYRLFPKKEIITRDYSGTFRYTYADFYHRVQRLANVLESLGVQKGDRVGTLAWNHHRHLELYFGVPCTGAVLHTLNLRLGEDQLSFIINHAGDKVIFVDQDLVPLLEKIKEQLTTVKHFVIMAEQEKIPETTLEPVSSYETLLRQAKTEYDFPVDLDEWSPASMCYTTATTGNPKGVVYTHRALFLHSMVVSLPDVLGLSEKEIIMPIVPMFHVNAWGLPFSATWLGATQVFPGARPQPEDICQLIEQERVTLSAAVPTVWMGCLSIWESGKYDSSSLRGLIFGGAAPSKSLIEAYQKKLKIPVLHAYGMTETTPVVLASRLKSYMAQWSEEEKLNVNIKQGLLVPGLEMKVLNEEGKEVAWNGKEMGELCLRGPWIAKEYYQEPERTRSAFKGGWLHTGDIVTVDEEGYVMIMDRAKDLIKSGGEWISSVDLENTIMGHPGIAEAAVIGVPHPKWQERPLAFVVLKPGYDGMVTQEDIIEFLKDKVAKWWLPDEVKFIDQIPKTSVGKINKRELRQRYI